MFQVVAITGVNKLCHDYILVTHFLLTHTFTFVFGIHIQVAPLGREYQFNSNMGCMHQKGVDDMNINNIYGQTTIALPATHER